RPDNHQQRLLPLSDHRQETRPFERVLVYQRSIRESGRDRRDVLRNIRASINKKDMDIGVVAYEVMPDGELFHLSYFLGRASYAGDMSVRKLLTPGKVESIPFDKTRMTSRQLSRGSRLLVTLNVNKNPYAQINY